MSTTNSCHLGTLHHPSLHLARAAIGVRPASDFEQHACINDCMRFRLLARDHWRVGRDDKCTTCGTSQFTVGESGKLTPHKVHGRIWHNMHVHNCILFRTQRPARTLIIVLQLFYASEVASIIAAHFADPEWTAAHDAGNQSRNVDSLDDVGAAMRQVVWTPLHRHGHVTTVFSVCCSLSVAPAQKQLHCSRAWCSASPHRTCSTAA
jgi:hypothetical protein